MNVKGLAKYCTKKCNSQHCTERLIISSLPSLSTFSTSKKVNMETIGLAQVLIKKQKNRKWTGYGLTGNFFCFFMLKLLVLWGFEGYFARGSLVIPIL